MRLTELEEKEGKEEEREKFGDRQRTNWLKMMYFMSQENFK